MTNRTAGRPLGEIHHAMLDAWRTHGPMTTREIAARAQVGLQAAHRTASRMLSAGAIVIVRGGRPAVFGAADHEQRAASAGAAICAAWSLGNLTAHQDTSPPVT